MVLFFQIGLGEIFAGEVGEKREEVELSLMEEDGATQIFVELDGE